MAAIVGINCKVQLSSDDATYTDLSERNDVTINVSVDVAEKKVFVATLADAWVGKARTWMNWSGSVNGYYDDADNTIFNTVVAGSAMYIKIYDDRAITTKYWKGRVLLTNVEHGVGTEDYATLNCDFEGIGALTRVYS
jgi:hypothetical protein